MSRRSNWMADTNPEAFRKLIERQRRMSAGEKLEQFFEMAEMLIRAVEDQVRREYPDAGEREIFLRAAARRIGPELVKKAYGWDPESGSPPPDASSGGEDPP